LSQRTVRPTPRWLYWSSLVVIGLPILLGFIWLHERLFRSEAGFAIGAIYICIAAALAAIVRFIVLLAWDALTMKPDPK
jgi:hypothetical protein